jgi:hypothetical protein
VTRPPVIQHVCDRVTLPVTQEQADSLISIIYYILITCSWQPSTRSVLSCKSQSPFGIPQAM